MSSGITYDVVVAYSQVGNLSLPPGYGDAVKAGRDLDKLYGGLGKSLSSGVGAAYDGIAGVGGRIIDSVLTIGTLAGAALVAGISGAMNEGIKFNEFKENALASFASIASIAGESISFDAELRRAEGTLERLRISAKQLPGELKDSTNFFSAIAPVTQQFSLERREKMSSQGVAAAMALGVAQPVAARELSAMLAGNARHSMPLFAKLGLGDSKAFNALSAAERFDKVEAQFAKLGPSIEHYAHTMAGLKSASIDTLKNVVSIATLPVYDKLKNSLENGLGYYAKHETEINAFARKLGDGIAWAYEAGLSYLHTWGGYAVNFGETLYHGIRSAFDYVKPHIDSMVHAAELIGGAAVGAKIASPVVGAGAKLASPLLDAAGLGGLATASVGAVVLGAALANLGAVFLALSDETSVFHTEANKSWEQLKFSFRGLGESFVSIWRSVGPAVILGVEAFGTVVLGIASTTATVLDGIVSVWASFFDSLSKEVNAFAHSVGLEDLIKPRAHHADLVQLAYGPKELYRGGADDTDVPSKAPPVHNVTNHNHFTIDVRGDADPARVAVSVTEILERKLRTSSRHAPPLFAGRTP